ncbi:hypothetical protein [Apilactobacillus bombintestini]|uniref:MucBP domain-containing protein n=1 Tax=Apilactobacillus bombintestini TaxID=2419772 RepID=A0A387ANA5_9LACO|nr:hypothetical protein [Apilactobacillus bombintestini]AYF92152.1 hypothetical protein D7I45_00930 [Apilactobacillus bombintestini]
MINKKILLGLLGTVALVPVMSVKAQACFFHYPKPTVQYHCTSTVVPNNISHSTRPSVYHVTYKYYAHSKKIFIYGKTLNTSRVAIKYGNQSIRWVNVNKDNTFKAAYHFDGDKNFDIFGLDSNGRKVTYLYNFTPMVYTSEKPVIQKAVRNDKGIMLSMNNSGPCVLHLYNNGHLIKKYRLHVANAHVLIRKSQLQSNYQLTITQSFSYQKTSEAVTVPQLAVGETYQVNY